MDQGEGGVSDEDNRQPGGTTLQIFVDAINQMLNRQERLLDRLAIAVVILGLSALVFLFGFLIPLILEIWSS